MKKRSGIAAVILTGILLLSGCGSYRYATDGAMPQYEKSSAAYSGGTNGGGAFYVDAESFDTAVAEESYIQAEAPLSAQPEVGETSQVSSRKLIRNVHMDVETREFDDLMVFVESSVKAAGGYVENSYSYYGSVYRGGGNTRSASLTLRIPAAGLDQFLSDVGGRANVISRNENVSDITLTYVDMESHKNALRTEEESLINMMAKAETVEELITIESRLADVRYQIESMESQLRTYDNLVDYATLSLSITEVEELTPVVEQSAWEKMGNGFMNSIHNIGRGLQNFGIGFVMNLPYILIWGVVIVVIFLIAKALIKKLVRKIRIKMGKDVPAVKKETGSKEAEKAAQTAETADAAEAEKPENP